MWVIIVRTTTCSRLMRKRNVIRSLQCLWETVKWALDQTVNVLLHLRGSLRDKWQGHSTWMRSPKKLNSSPLDIIPSLKHRPGTSTFVRKDNLLFILTNSLWHHPHLLLKVKPELSLAPCSKIATLLVSIKNWPKSRTDLRCDKMKWNQWSKSFISASQKRNLPHRRRNEGRKRRQYIAPRSKRSKRNQTMSTSFDVLKKHIMFPQSRLRVEVDSMSNHPSSRRHLERGQTSVQRGNKKS